MKIRKVLLGFLWAMAELPSLSSLLLYLKQGGFGGGHGRFDEPIFLLAWPWTNLPYPQSLYAADFIWLLLVPFMLNTSIAATITFLVLRTRATKCEA
jgi:hypothetical protein